jgi:hypothetical protein
MHVALPSSFSISRSYLPEGTRELQLHRMSTIHPELAHARSVGLLSAEYAAHLPTLRHETSSLWFSTVPCCLDTGLEHFPVQVAFFVSPLCQFPSYLWDATRATPLRQEETYPVPKHLSHLFHPFHTAPSFYIFRIPERPIPC